MTHQGAPHLIAARGVSKEFRHRGGGDPILALDDVSLEVGSGDSVAIVGESGSGKSTLGRCLMRLIEPTKGEIDWRGRSLASLRGESLRAFRSAVQMVFQDPYDSLDPRMDVRAALAEPLQIQKRPGNEIRERTAELLDLVRLSPAFLDRLPHQLSGGQQQRIGIARALANEPQLLILDEPTSALDWLVRAEILDLLMDLRMRLGLTYILISHDLSAVRRVTDRVVVMYLGKTIEVASTDSAFHRSAHPYTRALLSAVLPHAPRPDRRRLHLTGEVPDSRPSGCPFHPRCPISVVECSSRDQVLQKIGVGHEVACWRVSDHHPIDWPDGWVSNAEAGGPMS